MYNVINVVYTKRKLSDRELESEKQHAFEFDGNVKIGDMLTSPDHYNKLQVTNVYYQDSPFINGKPLKKLTVTSINDNKLNNSIEMKNSNQMFGGLMSKYQSQYIPQMEDSVKMSIQGTLVVPVNGEYIGMDNEGNLISYDPAMTINIPVYSINVPTDKVQIGDIIKNGNSFGKVIEKNADGSLKILSFSGYTHNKKEVKDALLGQSVTRVLVNMFNFNNNNTGFNPIMFAMAQGDKFDVQSLMVLSMMPEGKNLFNGINPAMLMMLDNNGDSSKMLPYMMMMGNNPFQPQQQQAVTLESILSNPDLVTKLKEALK